jgi:L-alanine-DL-glutamate epimerase-like enolase superfamily enzyme
LLFYFIEMTKKSTLLELFKSGTSRKMGKFTLHYFPYLLELKHVFTVASGSRRTTPVVLTAIEYEGFIGYGEASMPFYLGESHETVIRFLNKVDLSTFTDPFLLEDILKYIDGIDLFNTAAKASIDIALHDLIGKIMQKPWYKIWGFSSRNLPITSFTIGLDTEEMVGKKVLEAQSFKLLKVKLGLDTDKMMIETIRKFTDKPICVDINQGWKDKKVALDMAFWLAERNVVFIEQPMAKERVEDNAWLTENSPIPTFGDEAVQRIGDVKRVKGIYSGINIKLMKCTGMREAHKMVHLAKALDLKVMLGCMTETSCAISAASQLAPMADWVDLDGALLISNDIYTGMQVEDGKVVLSSKSGIGIESIV